MGYYHVTEGDREANAVIPLVYLFSPRSSPPAVPGPQSGVVAEGHGSSFSAPPPSPACPTTTGGLLVPPVARQGTQWPMIVANKLIITVLKDIYWSVVARGFLRN